MFTTATDKGLLRGKRYLCKGSSKKAPRGVGAFLWWIRNVLGLNHDRLGGFIVYHFNIIGITFGEDALVKGIVVAKVCDGTRKVFGDGAAREGSNDAVAFALPTVRDNWVKRVVVAGISNYRFTLSHLGHPFSGVLSDDGQVSFKTS
jgi:hypothetical protein